MEQKQTKTKLIMLEFLGKMLPVVFRTNHKISGDCELFLRNMKEFWSKMTKKLISFPEEKIANFLILKKNSRIVWDK